MKKPFVILDDIKGHYRWVVGICEGEVCQDCFERRDKIEPMEYWEKVGLPKSGLGDISVGLSYLLDIKDYRMNFRMRK